MTLTIASYLRALPRERQQMLRSLRDSIRRNLPSGYVEHFEHTTISYVVPLATFPRTYNGRPLLLAALASQKSFVTLYLMAVYGDRGLEQWFRAEFKASGRKLDMGKSCVHFRHMDDIPIDLIGAAIAKVPVRRYIALHQRARGPSTAKD